MKFADRSRERRVTPARDIGVGMVLVAVVCLVAAGILARGGPDATADAVGAGGAEPSLTIGDSGSGTPVEPSTPAVPLTPTTLPDTTGAEAGAADTPGSSVSFHFDAPSLKRIDFSVQAAEVPGAGNVTWSNQVSFTDGAGAVVGMQTLRGAPDAGQFLFSAWSAVEAKPGSAGTVCQVISDRGAGRSCQLRARPAAGHLYDFRVTADGGGWFTARVLDTTAHTDVTLGSIRIAEAGDLGPDTQTRVEYSDGDHHAPTCVSQPPSAAVVAPIGDGRQAVVSGHRVAKPCGPREGHRS